jgi:hypothetical protein
VQARLCVLIVAGRPGPHARRTHLDGRQHGYA